MKTEAYEEGDLTVDLLISLHIRRSYAFYYNNSIVPLYTIAVFGCVSFALEPSGLSDRVNLLLRVRSSPYTRCSGPPSATCRDCLTRP